MSVIGEAFVAIEPISTGFSAATTAQIEKSGLGGDLEKQFANAGIISGNSFAGKFKNAVSIAGLDSGPALGAAIAVASLAGLAAIGNQFAKVNKQIQNETGQTGAVLASLGATVTASFRQVPESLGQAATAVDELFRRGVPLGPQLQALATQEGFLAKITKTDLAANVDTTTAIFQKFGIAVGDQSRELDVLFKASQQSGKSFDTLTSGLLTGAASLQTFGFGLDQSAALLASLEKAGVNIQPALAGLRLAFGKIASEGGDPQKVLASLLQEFQNGTSPTKALADAIQLFGKRSGTELAVAISKGKFNVDGLLKSITDGKGGIVATGLATLTLGDQFKLLRNNIEADLSNVGTGVLQALETGLRGASAPAEALATSIGHLVVALAPVAQDLLVFLAPLALAGPLITDFANGLDTIASGIAIFTKLPGPVQALAAALAVLGTAGPFAAGGLLEAAAASTALSAAIDFATGPIGITIAAITALGAIVGTFTQHANEVKAATKTETDALLSTATATGIYGSGIQSATQFLLGFIDAELQAGKNKDLNAALLLSGSNATDLAKALTGSQSSFDAYVKAAQRAADAQQGIEHGFGSAIVGGELADQRKEFIDTANATLQYALATKEITPAQLKAIESSNNLTKSSGNYGAALNQLNGILAQHVSRQNAVVVAAASTATQEAKLSKQLAAGSITADDAKTKLTALGLTGPALTQQLALVTAKATELNQAQDLLAGKTVITTAAYGNLARAIATGTITEGDAETAFHKMGFSIDGSKTAFSDLQTQISSFVQQVVSQLPSVSSVISDLSSATGTDTSQLASDLKEQQSLRDQANQHTATASASLQKSLADVNSKIALDQQRIANGSTTTTTTLDNDLRRRTLLLQNANTSGSAASKSLADNIAKNNAAIHADYAKLAADNDPLNFAKQLFASAVQIAKFQANLQTLISEGLGNLAGDLALQGPKAAGALAAALAGNEAKAKIAGAAANLSKTASDNFATFSRENFAQLTLSGQAEGNAIGKAVVDEMSRELIKLFPQLAPVGYGLGQAVGGPAVTGVAAAFSGPGLTALNTTLKQHLEPSGEAMIQGVIDGLNTKQSLLYKRITDIAGQVVVEINNAWAIKSPSKVATELGALFGEGLALGLEGSTSRVTAAASGVAKATVQTFEGVDIPGIGRFQGKEKGSFPTQAPPDAQTIAAIAQSLQINGQSGLDRSDARAQFDKIAAAARPIEINVQGEQADPKFIAAELAWALR